MWITDKTKLRLISLFIISVSIHMVRVTVYVSNDNSKAAQRKVSAMNTNLTVYRHISFFTLCLFNFVPSSQIFQLKFQGALYQLTGNRIRQYGF
jgi:hypothetical protein